MQGPWQTEAVSGGSTSKIATSNSRNSRDLGARVHDLDRLSDLGNADSPKWLGYAEFASQTQRRLNAIGLRGYVGVVAVDIDHFEAVTSMFGASVGNEILIGTAERIRQVVRHQDLIARVDGNGFALVWSQQLDDTAPADLSSRINEQFNAPIPTSVGNLSVTVTVGLAAATFQSAESIEPETLLAQARAANAEAHRRGRARVTEFNPSMLDHAVKTFTTENQLRTALREETLSVAYQQIISLSDGQVVAVEALARWSDELFGSVSPALFIPIAEDSGLINDLGRLVLHLAVSQCAQWHKSNANQPVLTVNLSHSQLLHPSLIPTVKQLLDIYKVPTDRLCLEITESVVMNDVASSMTILSKLKDLGIVLAVDDFGTGYSSLSYLRRLPVDILKIDRSFVQSMHNRDDRAITKGIIDLAHTLGMTTVAEGVETPFQLRTLIELNTDMAQGFLLHRPSEPRDLDLEDVDLGAFDSCETIENRG